jgi:hypothetical protein
MNARQLKKKFKKQINKLKADNDLMQRIISDSPKMQEFYDLYNKPLNVTHMTIPFHEYKVRKTIPQDMENVDYCHYCLEHLKKEMASDLFACIEDNIVYDIHADSFPITITASIFAGRKSV